MHLQTAKYEEENVPIEMGCVYCNLDDRIIKKQISENKM